MTSLLLIAALGAQQALANAGTTAVTVVGTAAPQVNTALKELNDSFGVPNDFAVQQKAAKVNDALRTVSGPTFVASDNPMPQPVGRPLDIKGMLYLARRRVESLPGAPASVRKALSSLEDLAGQGRIKFAESCRDASGSPLPAGTSGSDPKQPKPLLERCINDDEIGLYVYWRKPGPHAGDGVILLHKRLREMGRVVDPDFLVATLFHEIGHQMDKDLDAGTVVDAEVRAFQLVQDWLKFVDPVKANRTRLANQLAITLPILKKNTKAAAKLGATQELVEQAVKYCASLDVLYGKKTKSDIVEYARELYPDGKKAHTD